MINSIFIGRELNNETRNWLFENNISFTGKALIDVKYNPPDNTFFDRIKNETKIWVVTSAWSARWLKKFHSEIGFNSSESVYCISVKQAKILDGLPGEILKSKEKNVKSLFDLVSEKCQGKTIVYLCGDKSLNIIQNELQSSAIRYFETEVYRNIPVAQKIVKDFDAYLFFSPSGIESFISAGNIIHESAYIFTIGKTTGNFAQQVFSNPVLVSPVQEETGFVEFAVRQLKLFQAAILKA